jgi:hypothetical protein
MDDVLLRETSPLGYSATLRRRNWERHEAKRPELVGHLENIGLCIRDPDIIIDDGTGCDHFYRAGVGTGKFANSYLHVLVRAFLTEQPAERTIVTAWFTREFEEGDVKWSKTP